MGETTGALHKLARPDAQCLHVPELRPPAARGRRPVPGVHDRLAGGRRAAGRRRPGMVAGRYLLQRQLGPRRRARTSGSRTTSRSTAASRSRASPGPSAWERLRREARLTARLGGHRHIVTVHDVFEDAGTPCLVARYMTGGSLADRLERAPAGGWSRRR